MGMDGFHVEVEADISAGMPSFDIVGLPDNSVKESKERVRTAMKNCNLPFPTRHVTINLAPANLKKEGASYDLSISVAILAASGQIKRSVSEYLFVGELALDGRLRRVTGVLPMVVAAKKRGIDKIIVPAENAHEAAVVKEAEIYPASTLFEVFQHFTTDVRIPRFQVDMEEIFVDSNHYLVDFSDVKGQNDVRRAVEIAVSGGHNILMIGAPGSGKSMIAKRIPTILPNLTYDEALETTKVHSIAGTLRAKTSLMTTRPFRSPHHTISSAGLAGGGAIPKPGELSLAHNGVLFMDELPEFRGDVLEVMRQPLEDGEVTISRVQSTLTYPCDTLFVASMNPCKCGYYGVHGHTCICTPPAIAKYRNKISGPLLDRIDIHIEVPTVKYEAMQEGKRGETSAAMKERINKTRKLQLERYKNDGIYSNSQLTTRLIEKYCKLSDECKVIFKQAFESFKLSARAHDRILKVARTIADMENAAEISVLHISEAIQYRNLDRRVV